ncbi:MAG: DUF2336 domain-containing protein [Proteobacteria bacterium]|nr:DUF2336 domain-containing protein [Pseudomonadota bacterium]
MEKKDAAVPTRMLSKEDIDALLTDRSARSQLDVVGKLADHYAAEGKGAMSTEEAIIANDIFRLLMSRGEVVVRATLSMHLSQTERLPPELARMMARDAHTEVACPMLQYSEQLNDEDLASIITSLVDAPKLSAIARRRTVSETISDMLVSTSIEQVVAALVSNEGAQISTGTFSEIVRQHGQQMEVMESLLQRTAVPLPVIEEAIAHFSPALRKQMELTHGDLNQMRARKRTLTRNMEQSALRLMNFKSTDAELMQLLQELEKTKKLSPFSALSMCNLQLFEVYLSRLLRVPLKNIKLLLQDDKGFTIAYERAGLPGSLREATGLAVRALRALELEQSGMELAQTPSSAQVMSRMRQMAGGKFVEGLDRLFALMQHYNR